MTTSTELMYGVVSSTGEIIDSSFPIFICLFALVVVLIAYKIVIRTMRAGIRKVYK